MSLYIGGSTQSDREMSKEPDADEFQTWEQAVNRRLIAMCGLGIDDLPDWGSYDAWKSGMSVEEAAQEWYVHAGECY